MKPICGQRVRPGKSNRRQESGNYRNDPPRIDEFVERLPINGNVKGPKEQILKSPDKKSEYYIAENKQNKEYCIIRFQMRYREEDTTS